MTLARSQVIYKLLRRFNKPKLIHKEDLMLLYDFAF